MLIGAFISFGEWPNRNVKVKLKSRRNEPMNPYIGGFILAGLLTGCAGTQVKRDDDRQLYRVSFPSVALNADPLERIESVEVILRCGRFAAINHIPDDWSAQVISPVSEETTLRMEAGHGSSELCHAADLKGFITVLVCEPACFNLTASLTVSSYDTELHERKVYFQQSQLVMKLLSNTTGGEPLYGYEKSLAQ